jgi:predicted nucleotidyltransferase
VGIAGALFGATRQALLRILFGHADRRFYQRQLISMAGLGSGAVQRELANLTEAGILTRTVEGHQTYYQVNTACPVYGELSAIARKTFGIADVLRRALEPFASSIQVAFVYGSIAEGREKAGSDVDLMIVGDAVQMDDVVSATSEAEQALGREVNPSVYHTTEFCRKLTEGHHFLSRVLDGPKIFLIGDDGELTRLAQIRMADGAPSQPPGNRRSLRGGGSGS